MQDNSCEIVNIDHEFEYEGYNTDFGPLTLNFVHKFISRVDSILNIGEKKKVVHQCSQSYKHQANASFLIGAYLMVSHNWPISEV